MRITQQPAYVLHARPWRETSLLLETFTRDFGRVGLVARGVRGARARLPRSLLEPMQALRLGWSGRGELQTLTSAEPDGPVCALRGDALLSALYVNELLVRLTARNDPHPGLFDRYAALLSELSGTSLLAWRLRCFERDLLAALGYAMQLETAADTGAAIDPATTYDYLPEQGAVAVGSHPGGVRVRGSALLSLASGASPVAEDLAALRRLMRALIGAHVGERGLQSWRVLAGPLRSG
ncbi:MAG: DNA recombination and repair protein RecO [Rhodanobacteraceae bacterium]|jgi:DNA repair protein RecO (recombination protein O)|nr:MAG: DNA recombination and repair protein RecO [Rhodanobacteraceae bacterium]